MTTRFTDQARRALARANEEAQRQQQKYIGTEHILMGLVQLKDDPTAQILRECGLDIASIRSEVQKRSTTPENILPLGKQPHGNFAKQAIAYALRIGQERNFDQLGTEHLLLGLLLVEDGAAIEVLNQLGIHPSQIRERVLLAINDRRENTNL